jgi:hypothetical protein
MKNYVKIFAVAAVLALAVTAFCAYDPDWYDGRRPTDQPGTKWVCEKYGMSFEVDENGLVKNGVLKTEGGEVSFDFLWAVGTTHVTVLDAQSADEWPFIFDGFCEFGRKSFEINVSDDPYDYFPDSCTLHFDRVDQ